MTVVSAQDLTQQLSEGVNFSFSCFLPCVREQKATPVPFPEVPLHLQGTPTSLHVHRFPLPLGEGEGPSGACPRALRERRERPYGSWLQSLAVIIQLQSFMFYFTAPERGRDIWISNSCIYCEVSC